MILRKYESDYTKGSLIVKNLHKIEAMSESFAHFSRHPSNLKIGMFIYCDKLGIDLYGRVQTNMILDNKDQIEVEDFLTNRYLNRSPRVMYAAESRLFHGRKRFEILNTVRVKPIEENFSIEIELQDNQKGISGEYSTLSVSVKYGQLLFPIFWHKVMKTENLPDEEEGEEGANSFHYVLINPEELNFDIGKRVLSSGFGQNLLKKSPISDKIHEILCNYLKKDYGLTREQKPSFMLEGNRIVFDSETKFKFVTEATELINELITELEALCASLNLPIEVRYTT